MEAELLNLTCGRTAAAHDQPPGSFSTFRRLPWIGGYSQIAAVPAQRPFQHLHARIEAFECLLPGSDADPLDVDDVIDAELVFDGFAGCGQHEAERVVVRQESREKSAAGPADLCSDRHFFVATEQRRSGDLAQIHSHFVDRAWQHGFFSVGKVLIALRRDG